MGAKGSPLITFSCKNTFFLKKICTCAFFVVPLHPHSQVWYLARAVRDRSAKPGTAVRIRQVPQKKSRSVEWLFLI